MVLSDTPGVIKPNYEMQSSMMDFVKGALEDADILKTGIFTTFEGKKCNAVIATALKTIKMPEQDFKTLTSTLKKEIDELIVGDTLSLPKACSNYNIGALTLKIAGLYYHVP